jgi:hypothetical protein
MSHFKTSVNIFNFSIFVIQNPPINIGGFCWLNAADAVRTWFVENGWIFIAHKEMVDNTIKTTV